PHRQEALSVAARQVELVNEHDRAVVVLQLLDVGDLVVHLTQSHRSRFPFSLLGGRLPSLRLTCRPPAPACFRRASGPKLSAPRVPGQVAGPEEDRHLLRSRDRPDPADLQWRWSIVTTADDTSSHPGREFASSGASSAPAPASLRGPA